ncbi:MAG TPA: site-specific DNA-methyltransferase [Desulfotomaculum sp.]|nr:site-specific DNA-methyltransferase [Desulfotomaculum sp.]
MEKLKLMTEDLVQENIEKLAEVFPGVITEARDEKGDLVKAVDFELLKQELSDRVVEGDRERYQLTWPGKKEAVLMANMPINKTLRPVKEESVDWENTGNLYIEGDNLEALKILQESYLNKIKCIYIDPPYNTGKDFIYKDNFKQSREEYLAESGQVDDDGNRLFQNTESNGRFHSDWLSMMYPRLKLARNLLREDGVIFVSIDDNEVHNLRKICDEVFGEENCLSILVWDFKSGTSAGHFTRAHEFIVVYAKNKGQLPNFPSSDSGDIIGRTTIRPSKLNPYSQIEFPAGLRFEGKDAVFSGTIGNSEPVKIISDEMVFKNGKLDYPVILESAWRMRNQIISWINKKETYDSKGQKVIEIYFNEKGVPWYKKERGFVNPKSLVRVGNTKEGTLEIEDLFGKRIMLFPKPSSLMRYLIDIPTSGDGDEIILDFFSGSATTAHAVMQLNAEDGGNRKYIMVQLPEPCPEDSEAYKAGFKNISEIGKERIRRAVNKIKEETGADIDYGFRVFKVDSSNMKDVYYRPDELLQQDLFGMVSNIKEDRTGEDLLIQIMLEWGLELSLPMEKRNILGKEVRFVAGNSLVACFDEGVSEGLVREIAKKKPLRVVFRDSSFAGDAARINVEELFKMLSPTTEIKVI